MSSQAGTSEVIWVVASMEAATAASEVNGRVQEEVIVLPPSGPAEVLGPLADVHNLQVMSPTRTHVVHAPRETMATTLASSSTRRGRSGQNSSSRSPGRKSVSTLFSDS